MSTLLVRAVDGILGTHSAKKQAGKATGNRSLEAKGEAGQTKGNFNQAGAKVKDAFKH